MRCSAVQQSLAGAGVVDLTGAIRAAAAAAAETSPLTAEYLVRLQIQQLVITHCISESEYIVSIICSRLSLFYPAFVNVYFHSSATADETWR